jgi:hypothetical protein
MSTVYEVGFILNLRDDLSDEIYEMLAYMITGEESGSAELPSIEHPLFNVKEYPPEEWAYLINDPREYAADQGLGEGYGSVLTDEHLVFHGLVHEDSFWNIWREFTDWLSAISFSTGLVGYYREIYEDDGRIGLISFEMDGVHRLSCESYSELEAIRSQIIKFIEDEQD